GLLAQLRQHLAPAVVIDRAAIVGVGEAEIPQLRSLIGIRHAGGGELDERGGQRVVQPVMGDLPGKAAQVLQEWAARGGIESPGGSGRYGSGGPAPRLRAARWAR